MTLAYNLSQLANYVNSSGQVDAATGLTNTSSLGFPTGTLMLFQQTAAPTGWTKQTTHNNKALRVVSGTASSGGTTSFSDVFTNQTPTINTSGLTASATTLSTAQMASHTHGSVLSSSTVYLGAHREPDVSANSGFTYTADTGSAGSSSSHSHSISGSATSSAITLDIQYVDLIIAIKN